MKHIVGVHGGLGNQFFIYAMAKNLKRQAKLLVTYHNANHCNTTHHENPLMPMREYSLNHYNISLPYAWSGMYLCYCIIRKIKPILKCKTVTFRQEGAFTFVDESQFDKSLFLLGFWQNLKYFDAIKPVLQREFTYKDPLSATAAACISEARNNVSVAVHVRRGDYLTPQNTHFHILPIEHYTESMQYYRELFPNCKFFVFSNDIDWCKNNFAKNDDIVFIDESISTSMYEDFEIMRNCHHYIIANSTFSWWAAYLSETDENKKVIAPANWFKDKSRNERCVSAIIPNDWILK